MKWKTNKNREKNRENREKFKFSLLFANILNYFRKFYILEKKSIIGD